MAMSERRQEALAYIEVARRMINDGRNAIPELEAAIASLRIDAGDLPPTAQAPLRKQPS
jgi:hypothetical protein